MKKLDLAGQRFDHLTALEPAANVGKYTAWRCLCDCGNETVVLTTALRSGDTGSCGKTGCLYRGRRVDLTGQVVGHLTILGPAENVNGFTAWRCRCDCGNETVVRTSVLRSGHTKSCGQPGCVYNGNRTDLTGRRHGHLTVTAPADNIDGYTAWTCVCDCGREVAVTARSLREGTKRNCGDPKCPYSRRKPSDLTGDVFVHLTVTGPAEDHKGRAAWLCRCDCGRETVARAVTLRAGRAVDCGHPDCPYSTGKRQRDLAGRRYGSLTALRQVEDVDGQQAWLCRCDCGEETVVRAFDLQNSYVRSCGCSGKGPGPGGGRIRAGRGDGEDEG